MKPINTLAGEWERVGPSVVENYNEAKVKAEAARRGLTAKPGPLGGLVVNDPNGLEIGIAGRG